MSEGNFISFTNLNFSTEIITKDHFDIHRQDVAFFIIDDYFKPTISEQAVHPDKFFWINAKESNKTLLTVEKILNKLSELNIKRTDIIAGIGGGIVMDIAAFCANIHKRGCVLHLYPTTLLGMIDACIGGKTGVNLNNLKNQIGTFYPAKKIILNFDFLKTLHENEIKNGYAELIKMMIISHRDFFDVDYADIEKDLPKFILLAMNDKLEFCKKDLTDNNIRHSLNLGHTFAHLLETVTDFRVSHGSAVAMGLRLALKISNDKGWMTYENYQKILKYIDRFCDNVILNPEEKRSIKTQGKQILLADKKTNEYIRLVLINNTSVDFYDCDDVEGLISRMLLNY